MGKNRYQGNWRGARRYGFADEVRRKKAERAKAWWRTDFASYFRRVPIYPVALTFFGLAGVAYSASPAQVRYVSALLPGSGCLIKGNITPTGERIYHVPGQSYYRQTRIAVHFGERWFCTEAEARSAGWRRART